MTAPDLSRSAESSNPVLVRSCRQVVCRLNNGGGYRICNQCRHLDNAHRDSETIGDQIRKGAVSLRTGSEKFKG